MADEKTFTKEFRESRENKRIGSNFLGILNDIKRRPSDAAKELEISNEEIQNIINGQIRLSSEIISKATKIWPVNARDFYVMHDDCPNGLKIMRCEDSVKSSRIMHRAGKPYYEYRDTAMSSVGPFRPEWIEQLCIVDDNEPNNRQVQWNNGHFMHQFTYFIGAVNFYYIDENGEKKVAIMNTGDSNYITPFIPHSFATRKGAGKNGLILALTYGNNLSGDSQHELSSMGKKLAKEFALDFSSKETAGSSLIKFHRNNSSLTLLELSERTNLRIEKLKDFENGKIPTYSEYAILAECLNVNVRDLLSYDKISNEVVVQLHKNTKKWFYPEDIKNYELVELANSNSLPYSKALEINVLNENDKTLDLKIGLHQYGYNIGETDVSISYESDDGLKTDIIKPGDSFYLKPFVEHNFRGKAKLLVLRISGRITGEPQRELSLMGKKKITRIVNESLQWFDSKGKN
jgi:methylphosphonate synthase